MSRPARCWGVWLAVLSLSACVSPPPRRPAALVQGERFLTLGVAAYSADDYLNAASLFGRALEYYRGLDDRGHIVESRIDLAETALAVGNFTAADGQLQAARQIADSDGMAQAQQRLSLLQSTLAIRRGQYALAAQQLSPLLSSADTEADIRSSALANRTDIALHRADDPPAPWLERFAAVVRDAHDPLLEARLLRFQAELKERGGDDRAAATLLRRALGRYKSIPNRAGTAATLEQWGALLAAQRQWAAAADRLQRALDVRLWLLDRAATVADLRRMADVNEAAGHVARAAALRRWAGVVAGRGAVDWSGLRQEVLPR